MSNINKLFNIAGFQLSWGACVFGVQNGHPHFGSIIMAFFLFVHILFFKINTSEIIFIAIVIFLGAVLDTVMLQTTLINYQGLTFEFMAPIWILAMWAGFATTINHSLSRLDGKWFYAILFGSIFGPFSYIAGVKFDALVFHVSFFSITILAIVWGLTLPFLFYLNNKIVLEK